MAKTFQELDANDAQALVSANATLPSSTLTDNRAYMAGDHWRGGQGILDTAVPSSPWQEVYQELVTTGMRRLWVSQNLIRECVGRRTDGVLAKPCRTQVKTQEGESEDVAKAKLALLDAWAEEVDLSDALADFADRLSSEEKCYLRLRVLAEHKAETLEEALAGIFVEMVPRDEAAMITDQWTGYESGLIAFDHPSDDDPVSSASGRTTGLCSEHTYLDTATGETVLRINSTEGDKTSRYDLGGRLMLFEGKSKLMTTSQVIQAQKGVNTALTLMGWNNKQAGFQQRIFLNAMPPGTVVIDRVTQKPTFKVEALDRGADQDIFLVGVEENQETGEKKIMVPDMKVLSPSEVRIFIESLAAYRIALYRQYRQLHMELSDAATPTGEARMQAAADHEQDLNKFKRQIEKAGRWAYEAAYDLAEVLAGRERTGGYRVEFECVIDLGPIAAARRQNVVEEVRIGLKSLETGRAEIGITDPAQEGDRVRRDRKEDAAQKEQWANVIKTLREAGVTDDAIIALVGAGDLEFEEPEPPPAITEPLPPAPPVTEPMRNGQ